MSYRLLIAGGRDFIDYPRLKQYVDWLQRQGYTISEIVSGTARGADMLGEQYAIENEILIKRFYPDWDTFGKRAGYIRNVEMGKYCDNALIFWNGKSKGSKHMIDIMKKLGKKYKVLYY